MSHWDIAPEKRREMGISDSMVRLSVGLEDVDALIDDLEQAIEKAF
jgi:cystathionine beta-lyase/cystathionine gamma-synthase